MREIFVSNNGHLPMTNDEPDWTAVNFAELIRLMPSIEHTFYENACTDAASMVRIVLSPEDYILCKHSKMFYI